jgi:hypothetical protein
MPLRLFIYTTLIFLHTGCAQKLILTQKLITATVKQYEKAEFDIAVAVTQFNNPYDEREVALDMKLMLPSGKTVMLPCYYSSQNNEESLWKARFTPQESGIYNYTFQFRQNEKLTGESEVNSFQALATRADGFLHTNGYWTLRFDSGKPFRGIGENVGWEARSFEDPKWTYDYLLPTLSSNGANFFRTWMCVWNLPVAWKKIDHTNRYSDAEGYFNESGIKRMDELVALCDSLELFFMLSIDAHGALIPTGEWKYNNHNSVNGGPAATPTDFFNNVESKAMYKNRLRYLVARWGYSPAIAAWEFFNEIDNAVFTSTPHDSVLIDPKIITSWHDEMSTYLKKIDPYQHIVTTSVSHRDIEGMNELPNIDLNQKHIYNRTHEIAPTIKEYTTLYKKPYVIGEFGYDWDWNKVTHDRGEGFDFDYKRGLWYGMFNPTPILPMTWWWEFFDDRKMTPYFNSVRDINDQMLTAGKGSFDSVGVSPSRLETYAVKCGDQYFVYALNHYNEKITSDVILDPPGIIEYSITSLDPGSRKYEQLGITQGEKLAFRLELKPREERIIILKPIFWRTLDQSKQ